MSSLFDSRYFIPLFYTQWGWDVSSHNIPPTISNTDILCIEDLALVVIYMKFMKRAFS